MIYLDHQATTPVDPRVLEAMLPYLGGVGARFGNPSSKSHAFGWQAEAAVKLAREQVALAVGAEPGDVVFTSGATEALNLAIRGTLEGFAGARDHLVVGATEHPAVLDCARAMAARGAKLDVLSVDREGQVDLGSLARVLTPRTALVAVMAVNNEIGTIAPVAKIGALCRERGVPFLTDATQAVGKVPLDVEKDHVDLLSMSAHKLYGPKGAGALIVRKKSHLRLVPQVFGGGQEGGLRAGTSNVPGIVGLGKACEIGAAECDAEAKRLIALRERLHLAITGALDEVHLNGPRDERLPGNLSLAFGGIDGESLLADLRDVVALSSGSACASSRLEASHVLAAIGLDAELAHATLRFGLGRGTTAAEIDQVAAAVIASVRRLRDLSPLYELRRAAAAKPAGPAPGA